MLLRGRGGLRHLPTLVQRRRASSPAGSVLLIAMPQLSPTHTSGHVREWHKAPGAEVSCYDLLLSVSALDVVDTEKGELSTFLLEAQEDGVLARVLVQSGSGPLRVGTPLGVLCEEPADAPLFRDWTCPVHDVYDDAAMEKHGLRAWTWQAYKDS